MQVWIDEYQYQSIAHVSEYLTYLINKNNCEPSPSEFPAAPFQRVLKDFKKHSIHRLNVWEKP
jgi:hypothetical protein